MSHMVKFRNFCSGPIENKPISAVPGVGPASVDKFKKKNITMALQLYQQLQKLNFDLERFQVWLKKNCPGARGEYIYEAMIAKRRQFCENGGPAAGARSSQQNGHQSSAKPPRTDNPLQLFFASFADSCKDILPKFHTALKKEILDIVVKYEEKSRESKFAHPHPPAPAPAPVASTSQNGA